MADPAHYWLWVTFGVFVGAQVFRFICSVLEALVRGGPVDLPAGEGARTLLERLGIADVTVVETEPHGRDSFAADEREVRLKPATYEAMRAGAWATATHELGHVLHAVRYPRLLAWHRRLMGQLGRIMILTGILLLVGRLLNWTILLAVGRLGFGIMVLLILLKLAEEVDASRRGIRLLTEAADLFPPSGRWVAVVKLSLAFGTYLGLLLPFPVFYGFLIANG